MRRLLLAGMAVGLLVGCGQVDPGERAVFVRWGVMDQKCYQPALYWYFPVGTNMDLVDIQVQAFEAKDLSAATKDLQEVHATVVVNYALDGDQCHKLVTEVGHQYREKILYPALQDALKAGTAHFTIDQIIRERSKLREEVTKALQERVRHYYILVNDQGVNLTNFGLSKTYMTAVEQKQIAEQNVITATRNAERAAAEAKGKADAAREEAKGQADAAREQAKGEADALRTKGAAQADFNDKVSKSLTQILIDQQRIQAWQAGGAQVPNVIADPKAGGFFLQLPTAAAAPQKKE